MAINDSISSTPSLPNGRGAAAVLAAALSALSLGMFTLAGDKSPAMKAHLIWWKPTGPLSGVTTLTILVWLVSWVIFGALWRNKEVALRRVLTVSYALLVLSLLLTFPPIIDRL